MRVAFLNLCHCDPDLVARVTNKLTEYDDFDMYIHVDTKTDITPFKEKLKNNNRAYFVENRKKVYWGGYNAIEATFEMLRMALQSDRGYEYFILLQNLDYPICSNIEINDFLERNKGTEFLRGCPIARTKDWHYSRKYKIYNKRDDDFYLIKHSKLRMLLHYFKMALYSITTIGFQGVIKENGKSYDIHYGAAQWGITRACAEYLAAFEQEHPRFNNQMRKMQFPDEEYFHTVVHNSDFKNKCSAYDEPMTRWLVNWRNLHYFEFPKAVTVFNEMDFEKLIKQDALFIRKVRTGISDALLDKIDEATK